MQYLISKNASLKNRGMPTLSVTTAIQRQEVHVATKQNTFFTEYLEPREKCCRSLKDL